MDRSEAVLRELNLYPLWKRRVVLAPVTAEIETVAAAAVDSSTPLSPIPSGRTTSHSTRLARNASQVAGYPINGRGELSSLGWPQLKAMVRDCQLCKLRAECTQTVFGVGDEQADWLFVGEGPGADEDAQGEPFVGQAGKLLDNMLLAIKLRRGKNVYIANIVKCRPPDNRTPEADEIATCLPYLQRQIALIQPKLIVALGKTAATALLRMGDVEGIGHPLASSLRGLGRDVTLDSLRGTLHDFNGIPLLVTYHPAYLLRSPMEKAKAWQDLCLAANTMAG